MGSPARGEVCDGCVKLETVWKNCGTEAAKEASWTLGLFLDMDDARGDGGCVDHLADLEWEAEEGVEGCGSHGGSDGSRSCLSAEVVWVSTCRRQLIFGCDDVL